MAEFNDQNPTRDFYEFWFIIEGIARLELLGGRAERSAVIFGINWTWRQKDDSALTDAERPDYESAIAESRSAIRAAAFDRAFTKGQEMTYGDALRFALNKF